MGSAQQPQDGVPAGQDRTDFMRSQPRTLGRGANIRSFADVSSSSAPPASAPTRPSSSVFSGQGHVLGSAPSNSTPARPGAALADRVARGTEMQPVSGSRNDPRNVTINVNPPSS